jgi:hypothetical protein
MSTRSTEWCESARLGYEVLRVNGVEEILRRFYFSKELHLGGHFLRLGCLLAAHDDHPSPLGVRNHQATNLATRGNFRFKATHLRFHAVGSSARPGINAELHHEITILDQVFAEVIRVASFFGRADGKVEEYKHPSHTIFAA